MSIHGGHYRIRGKHKYHNVIKVVKQNGTTHVTSRYKVKAKNESVYTIMREKKKNMYCCE
jgi:predicted DNA binding protein